jgi:hypothetical protein
LKEDLYIKSNPDKNVIAFLPIKSDVDAIGKDDDGREKTIPSFSGSCARNLLHKATTLDENPEGDYPLSVRME